MRSFRLLFPYRSGRRGHEAESGSGVERSCGTIPPMAESERGERVVLTIGAIGRGVMSDPDRVRELQERIALEEALEPFHRAAREREKEEGRPAGSHRAFADVLKERKPPAP
jgi:hypothetical protein